MKAWITKYALTKGIHEVDGEIVEDSTTGMFRYPTPEHPKYDSYCHGEGKEWHRTLEGAQDRAYEIRNNKVIALKKQIAKLGKLTFEVKP